MPLNGGCASGYTALRFAAQEGAVLCHLKELPLLDARTMPPHCPVLPRRAVVALMLLSALVACKDRASGSPSTKLTADQVYALAAKATGIKVGSSAAADPVYVFFDPQCPACAALWSNTKVLIDRLEIVWIPVGILRRSSSAQGAAILSAEDPALAMDEHETSILDRAGGIGAIGVASEAKQKVADNTGLYKKTGYRHVPLIVYRNRKTGDYGAHIGSLTAAQLTAFVSL